MNGKKTYLFAFGIQVVNHFLEGLGNGAHGNNDILCIVGTIISKGFVFATGQLADLFHIGSNLIGNHIIVFIGSFA